MVQVNGLEEVGLPRRDGGVEFGRAAANVHPVRANDEKDGSKLRCRLVLEVPLEVCIGDPVRVNGRPVRGRNGEGPLGGDAIFGTGNLLIKREGDLLKCGPEVTNVIECCGN